MRKEVSVVVDRPLGSFHSKYKEIFYTVNYGYVEGIVAGDGEAQDAYILGIDTPIERIDGELIAIIRRLDDVEDKWVVAPDGFCFSKEEILKQVNFQEQYFNIEIIM